MILMCYLGQKSMMVPLTKFLENTKRIYINLLKGLFAMNIAIFAALCCITLSQANDLKISVLGKYLPSGIISLGIILILIFLYLGFTSIRIANKGQNIHIIPLIVFLFLTGNIAYAFIHGLLFMDEGLILNFKGIQIIKLAPYEMKVETYFSCLNAFIERITDLQFKEFLATCETVQKPNQRDLLSLSLTDVYTLVEKNIDIAKTRYLAIVKLNEDINSSWISSKTILITLGAVSCVIAIYFIYNKMFGGGNQSGDLIGTITEIQQIRKSLQSLLGNYEGLGVTVAETTNTIEKNLSATITEFDKVGLKIADLGTKIQLTQNALRFIAYKLDEVCKRLVSVLPKDKNISLVSPKEIILSKKNDSQMMHDLWEFFLYDTI